MEIPKIVQELLDKKAEMSNTVDLDSYANGLLDMYQALQLQQTGVSTRFTLFKEEKPNSPSQILAITDKVNFYIVDYENFLGNDILETSADFLPDEKILLWRYQNEC